MPKQVQRIEGGAHAMVPEGWEVTTPEAIALAEMDLIISDLNTAKTSLEVILQQTQGDAWRDQIHICEALFRDAIVQFTECFRNNGLNEDLYKDVERGPETLAYFHRVRDGFAAHRFGAGRQCAVVVTELGSGRYGFGQFHLKLAMPSPELLPEYILLVEEALTAAEASFKDLQQSVARQLNNMTVDEIRALKRFKMRTPNQDEFKWSRGQFRSGKGPR